MQLGTEGLPTSTSTATQTRGGVPTAATRLGLFYVLYALHLYSSSPARNGAGLEVKKPAQSQGEEGEGGI